MSVTPYPTQPGLYSIEEAEKIYNIVYFYRFHIRHINDILNSQMYVCCMCDVHFEKNGQVYVYKSSYDSTANASRFCLDCYDNKYNTKK